MHSTCLCAAHRSRILRSAITVSGSTVPCPPRLSRAAIAADSSATRSLSFAPPSPRSACQRGEHEQNDAQDAQERTGRIESTHCPNQPRRSRLRRRRAPNSSGQRRQPRRQRTHAGAGLSRELDHRRVLAPQHRGAHRCLREIPFLLLLGGLAASSTMVTDCLHRDQPPRVSDHERATWRSASATNKINESRIRMGNAFRS